MSAPKPTNKIQLAATFLAAGVLAGTAAGLVQGASQVASNLYINYGLWGLAWEMLRDRLNPAIAASLAAAAVVSLVTLLLAWRRTAARIGLGGLFQLLLAAGAVYLAVALAASEHGLAALLEWFSWSWLADAALLVGSLILVWLLARAQWAAVSGNRWPGRVRRAGGSLLVLLVLFNGALWLTGRLNRTQGPNVILIVVDTLRADALGVYGYSRDLSPSLDRFAEDAIVFENAVSHAPWTSPSVGATLTSRYPSELGFQEAVYPSRTGDDFLFMAEIMRANGYRTQAIVSHTYVAEELGFGQGFQGFDSENAQGHDYVSSPSVTEKASAFLQTVGDEPVFLMVHYFDPHFSYLLQPPFDYYSDYAGPLESGMDYNALIDYIPLMSAEDVRFVRALYDSEIRFTDRYVGVLLNELRNLNLYDNSLIIFTADHGETFREREDLWIGHGKTLYQELIHVPLIVKMDGPRRHEKISQRVGMVDLLPTLVDHLQLSIPEGYRFEGRSLPLADSSALQSFQPTPIFSETRAQQEWLQSLSWGNRKLILDRMRNQALLFDLANDPSEQQPIEQPDPSQLQEMATTLSAFAQEADRRSRELVREKPKLTEKQLEALRSLGYIR